MVNPTVKAVETGILNWLWSNKMPFGGGAISAAIIVKLAHLVGLLKFL